MGKEQEIIKNKQADLQKERTSRNWKIITEIKILLR